MSHKILHSTNSERIISAALVAVTFFSSMLITNDVALITFVPFTIGIFGTEKQKRLIFIITMETVAANLGSMLTPIGNPQNLYLYDKYNLSIAQFMGYVLPVGAVGAAIIAAVMIFRKDDIIESKSSSVQAISSKAKLAVYLILFAVCAASVLRFLDYRICLAVIVISIFITDKKLFVKVDYALLLTFVAFFIFVGNLRNIPAVNSAVNEFITGREFVASVIISQIISNVPAAVMLSGFTDNVRALIVGVNTGCLGTLVASLASLISYKLYCKSDNANPKKYLLSFTIINVAFLAAMLIFCIFVLKL